MNATQKRRLAVLEGTLSTAAGVLVEVTIRGLTSFTWSFEGRNAEAAAVLARIATGSNSRAEVQEIDIGEGEWMTAVYVEAGAL